MSIFIYWLLLPEGWVILGILLIAADFTIGADLFLLPIGISAFIIAAFIYAQVNLWFGDIILLGTWRQVIIWFSVLSVANIALIKFAFQRKRKDDPDINKYE